MRAYELSKLSPVEELKNKLPQLKDHNYNTIDKLMKEISHKHGLDPHGKKLHIMFISKYGHSPDHWIKQIKNKLGEQDVEENFIGMDPQGVAENLENFNGIDVSLEIQKDDEYVDDEDYDNQVIYVTASSNGRELGHVLFAFDGEYLMPQDLEVDERYRGQGIAATMYDYVKSKGYKIRRSGQQTDAGAGFWAKHRPEQNVWEQGVAEAEGTPTGVPHMTKKVLRHIIQQVGTEGAHAIVKSLEWGDGGAKDLLKIIVRDLKRDISENGKTYPSKIQQIVDRYKQLEREEKMLDLSDPREKQRNYHIQKELAQLEYDLMKMNASNAIDESSLNEGVKTADDVDQIKKFIKWSYETLNMQKPYPRIQLSKDTKKAQDGHHTGVHTGNNIWVYVANRNMIDIFRTIFHELTHHRQMQLNMIKDGDSYPGSPIEMLADMAAGKYIKIYGKEHPEMFQ